MYRNLYIRPVCLCRSLHQISGQDVHQPLAGQIAGVDYDVVPVHLVKLLCPQDPAVSCFSSVARSQPFFDNSLPLCEELLNFPDIRSLPVILAIIPWP